MNGESSHFMVKSISEKDVYEVDMDIGVYTCKHAYTSTTVI